MDRCFEIALRFRLKKARGHWRYLLGPEFLQKQQDSRQHQSLVNLTVMIATTVSHKTPYSKMSTSKMDLGCHS